MKEKLTNQANNIARAVLFLSLILLSSCRDDKEVLKDAIDILASKAVIEKEKDVEDFYLAELSDEGFYQNIGNLKFANFSDLDKLKKIKISKRNKNYNYRYFNSYYSEDNIVTAVSNKRIVNFDIKSKKLIWESKLDVPNPTSFISGGIVKVADYFIVVLGTSRIYALDTSSGDVVWQKDLTTNVRSIPLVHDNIIYLQTTTNKSYAIDYRTGEAVWFNDYSTKLISIFGSGKVAATDNLVMFPTSHGYLVTAQRDTGKNLWNEKMIKPGVSKSEFTLTDIEASIVIDQGVIYASSYDDSFVAADLNNGTRLWQKEIGVFKDFWISGNYIFAISKENMFVALDKNDGQVVWVADMPYSKKDDLCYSRPFVVDNQVAIIVSNGKLVLFDSETGKITRKIRIAKNVCHDFYIKNEILYLITDEGRLYKYAS